MQTHLTEILRASETGHEAERILRACVHCGFCTATCPTYQLLGDELDGPRGRIYLIKQVLEGRTPTRQTQQHLDRCLTCRACETTCPSGVHYARLLGIGRAEVDRVVGRSPWQAFVRRAIRWWVPHPSRLRWLLRLLQPLRPFMPASLIQKLPPLGARITPPKEKHARRMLVLDGCVQSVSTPQTNAALMRILDRLGIELVSVHGAGCCGALSDHLGAQEEGREFMRRNIDAWWPQVENGAEAIVVSASGCGVTVKEYGDLFAGDNTYGARAGRISELAHDPAEVLAGLDLAPLGRPGKGRRVAFHAPCTLQHGQGITGVVEPMLERLGYEVVPVADAHLCCGSAGSYSLLQPGLSRQLRDNKLAALSGHGPDIIASANIGCQLHLAAAADVPVVHWLELLLPG